MFPRHLATVSEGTPPLIYVCLSHSYMQRGINVCSHTSKATRKSTNKKDMIFLECWGGWSGNLGLRGWEGEAILGHLKYLSNFGASQKISITLLLLVLDGSLSNFYPFPFGFHTAYKLQWLSKHAHKTTQRNQCLNFRGTRDFSMHIKAFISRAISFILFFIWVRVIFNVDKFVTFYSMVNLGN